MSRKRLQTLGRFDVPNADRLVERTGNDEIRLRVEVAAEDVVGMSLQGLHTFAGGQLPNLECLVVGGGDEKTRIAGPRHVGNAQPVAGNRLLELAVVSAPDLDELVGRGRGQPLAVGREFDG